MAAEDSSSLSPISFIKKHYEGWKEFWCERFSFRDNNKRLIEVRAKNPSWSDSDIEAFIAIDPVHGPAIKAAREAVKMATMGSVIGAVSTAGMAWKYSKSPHGAVLSFGAGAIFGWTFGTEAAAHWLQLYRHDARASNMKFLDWWVNKQEGQSSFFDKNEDQS